ncbi:protein of unknown function (DUF4646) domain containing protein [Elaphomyces granulatus]
MSHADDGKPPLSQSTPDSSHLVISSGLENRSPYTDPPPAYSLEPLQLAESMGEGKDAGREDHWDAESLADNSYSSLSERAPLILSTRSAPSCMAKKALLSPGLHVPSKSRNISSGFKYPAILAAYDVCKQDWARFTQEVTQEAKLSTRQWTIVIGKGVGTFALTGMMIGVLGAIPAMVVATKSRQRQEERNLVAAVAPDSQSGLPQKIESWNESFFRPRGLMIRIELPAEIETLGSCRLPGEPVFERKHPTHSSNGDRKNHPARGRIVIIPFEKQSPSGRQDQRADDLC